MYFDTHFPAQFDYLHKEKLARLEACSSLLHEILGSKAKNITSYEGLYRKMVSYILVKSQAGPATDIRVIREATAALESVFPQSELNTFIQLLPSEKESQLNGLVNLVTGIRLFNKQLGKGGEAIDSLPELCAMELRQLTLLLHQHTEETEKRLQDFKAAVDYADGTLDSEVSPVVRSRLADSITFCRQYLIYLDALQGQVDQARDAMVAIGERFDDTLRDLKVTCKSKTTVPVDQVYVIYFYLASIC